MKMRVAYRRKGRGVHEGGATEKVEAELRIPRVARIIASLPPDLFGFSPTSSFALMVSLRAFSRLGASRSSRPAESRTTREGAGAA